MALEKLRTEISALEQKRDGLIFELETIEKESKAEFEKCNHEIMQKTYAIGYWEQVSGIVDNSDEIEELKEKLEEMEEALKVLTEEAGIPKLEEEVLVNKIGELEWRIEELKQE